MTYPYRTAQVEYTYQVQDNCTCGTSSTDIVWPILFCVIIVLLMVLAKMAPVYIRHRRKIKQLKLQQQQQAIIKDNMTQGYRGKP